MADFNDFKARYPELVSPGDANQTIIELYLSEALLFINLSPCPKRADSIQLAYAAHMIFKTGNYDGGLPDETHGIATSKSVGSVSISYQVSQAKGGINDWWNSSPYGRLYLLHLKMCLGSGIMVAP